MAPFNKSHTSSYSSSAVTMTISCIVSEIYEILVENRDFVIPLLDYDTLRKMVANVFALFFSQQTDGQTEKRFRVLINRGSWRVFVSCYYCCVAMRVLQCSYSVCLKTREENQRVVDQFADQWRVRAADPTAGDPADPFDCFYDASDPGRVISHKTYSRADVVHCMLWPSLVVVASAVTFLYLEARRSQLTFCGRRPSGGLNGEKSQLKAAASPSSSSHHHTKQHEHGTKAAGNDASWKVSDQHVPRHKNGRHVGGRLNDQVRSSVDVSVAGTSPSDADSLPSRRARHPHDHHPTAANKSRSASSLVAGLDTGVLSQPAGHGDGQRAADDDSTSRRPLAANGNDNIVVNLNSTPGRCASETLIDATI